MRKLNLKEWEEKYIFEPIEQFDQKYTVSKRIEWDPEMKQRAKGFTTIGMGEIKERPGYTLEELSFRWASRQGTILELLNISKPNLSNITKAIKAAIEASNPRSAPVTFRPPKGVKLDVSDPQRITRNLKRVATYFGADLVGVCKLDRRWVYSHTCEGENT